MISPAEFISVSILVKFLCDQFKINTIQETSGFFSRSRVVRVMYSKICLPLTTQRRLKTKMRRKLVPSLRGITHPEKAAFPIPRHQASLRCYDLSL